MMSPVNYENAAAPVREAASRSPPRFGGNHKADLAVKEAVLQHLDHPSPGPMRFKPDDRLLAFLHGL